MATIKIVDLELCTVTTATGGTDSKPEVKQLGSKAAVAQELAKLIDDGYGKLLASATVITLVRNDTPGTKRRVGMFKAPTRPTPPETFKE